MTISGITDRWRLDTDRHDLGLVVADGVKTGIDTSLTAGVKLGPEATMKPGENVLRDEPK